MFWFAITLALYLFCGLVFYHGVNSGKDGKVVCWRVIVTWLPAVLIIIFDARSHFLERVFDVLVGDPHNPKLGD